MLYLRWEKVSCLVRCPHFRGRNACKSSIYLGRDKDKGVVQLYCVLLQMHTPHVLFVCLRQSTLQFREVEDKQYYRRERSTYNIQSR